MLIGGLCFGLRETNCSKEYVWAAENKTADCIDDAVGVVALLSLLLVVDVATTVRAHLYNDLVPFLFPIAEHRKI